MRDAEGRVFTLSTLPQMQEVTPFPTLKGMAEAASQDADPLPFAEDQ